MSANDPLRTFRQFERLVIATFWGFYPMRLDLIGFGILAIVPAVAVAQPVIQAVPERPRLIVDGYGEVESTPDLAVISYTARGEGAKSDDAVRAMTAAEAQIEASIRGIDAAAQPASSEVRVTPVKSEDCKEQDSDTPLLSTGRCAILGYVAVQSVTGRSAAVKDAGTLVGLVGRGGGINARLNSFSLRDPRPAQQRATASALADAASKASAVAEAGHLRLGAILSINTTDRERDEITVTAARSNLPPPPAVAPPPPVVVQLTPEPITTSANVAVTYAIAQ